MSATEIIRVDLFQYTLTYANGEYVMSSGRVVNALPSLVVKLTTEGGSTGYGEACPLGATYLPAFAAGARAAIEFMAPGLLGADLANLARVWTRMDDLLSGHLYAKSAVDIACWDALGRTLGMPVAELLGGCLQDELPLYVAVPMGAPEQMAEFVLHQRALGIHRFQMKLGDDPVMDAQRAAAIVAATDGSDLVIADANGGWRRQDAIVAVRLLEPLDRLLLEQPCPTMEECLAIRKLTRLPMVLDEVIVDTTSLVRAISHQGMDHINLKIGRVGGLSRARVMRDLAVDLGIRLTVEDTWGGDLTAAAVSHLAAGVPPASLFAASFMNDWTNEHVAGYHPRSVGGRGPVPKGPGLGVEVDEEPLGQPVFTVAR